jgi:hypothetical protein
LADYAHQTTYLPLKARLAKEHMEDRPMSGEQAAALMDLAQAARGPLRVNARDLEAWLAYQATDYLTGLALDASAPSPKLRRSAQDLRRRAYIGLANRLGRRPSADDVLRHITPFGAVDPTTVEAVRRDLEQLAGAPAS